ncbi:MAG: PQQ-dependent sugar dehydrogenase [Actinomycetota bacterium]
MDTTHPTPPTRRLVATLAVTAMIAAGASTAGAQEEGLTDPVVDGGPPLALDPVADGLTAPGWGTSAPGLDDHLMVTDQDGIVWSVDLDADTRSPFLDVSDRLVSLGVGGPGTFDERGLLGLAFHPDYASNGLVYTYTSEPEAGPADFSTMPTGVAPNHQSVIAEWQVPDPTDPDSVVDPDTRREILRIDQPQFNHDAGTLVFGPEGLLYVALGDGGAADDQGVGHVPGGNGQDPTNVLGTILRIDPQGDDSSNGEYGIPADNPFVGDAAGADEVYAFGFRNPYRISFDPATGTLFAADVGQNDIEEIDVVVAGGNYGWPIKEGSACFDQNGADPGFAFAADPCPGSEDRDLIDPVAEYDHSEGIAVVGGFVYRGSEIPPLKGRYVFGDFLDLADGRGRLLHFATPNQKPGGLHHSRIRESAVAGLDGTGLRVLGLGQDADGELYLLTNQTGTPFGDTGAIHRVDFQR